MAKKKKSELVQKVAEETGVAAVDLERLPVNSLEKIEASVPDIDKEITAEEYQEEDHPGGQSHPEVKQPESVEPVPKRFVGYHPITGEKVYL